MTTPSTLPSRDEIIARRERLWGKPVSPRNLIVQRRSESFVIEENRRRDEIVEAQRRARIDRLEKEAEASRAFEIARGLTAGFATQGRAAAQFQDVKLPAAMGRPTMQEIALAVLDRHHGVLLEEVKSRDKSTKIVSARREVAIEIKRVRPDLSSVMIGKFLCRDHSTILHFLETPNPVMNWRRGRAQANFAQIKADFDAGMSKNKIRKSNKVSPQTLAKLIREGGWIR